MYYTQEKFIEHVDLAKSLWFPATQENSVIKTMIGRTIRFKSHEFELKANAVAFTNFEIPYTFLSNYQNYCRTFN